VLTAGELTSKVFTFLAFAYLARVLGPGSFGALEFTLALMVFLTLFVDFGTSPYGAREVARDPTRLPELLGNILRQRFGLAALAYGALFGVVSFMGLDGPMRTLLLIYGLTLFPIPGFVQWVFQGHDKMQWVALGSMIRWTIFAAGVFVAVRGEQHLWRVGLVELAAVVGFAAFNLTVLAKRFGGIRPRVVKGSLGASFREALPIGSSELTWAATWYFATVLVGILLSGEQVGWFGAAHRPVMTLHTFVWLYFYNLLPSMSRCQDSPIDVLRRLVAGSLRVTAWSAIFGAVIGTLYAGPIITLVFGAQYAASADVFRILVWMLPVSLVSGHYRYALIAYGQQKYEFYCALAGAVVSIGAGVPLVRALGIRGAAFALVASSLVNLLLALWLARTRVGRLPFAGQLVQPLVAGGVLVGIFMLLRPVNVWLAGAAGAAVYLAVMLLLQPEVRRLLGALRGVGLLALVVVLAGCPASTGGSVPTPESKGAAETVPASALRVSSYLGGSSREQIRDVAVDAAGNVYLTGGTMSSDFPVSEGTFGARLVAGTPEPGVQPFDVFVTKIAADGTLVWSTRLGGPNYDRAYAIEVDASGHVYVGGRAGAGFPVTANAAQSKHRGGAGARAYGGQDGFVAKLSPDGRSLLWATFFGTDDPQIIRDIDVGPDGAVYVAAGYRSGRYPAAVRGAFVNGPAGETDSVVARIAPDGSRVDWARFLGGSGRDGVTPSVRVGPGGTVTVVTMTESADAPTTAGAFDRSHNGRWDLYVVRLAGADGALGWATLLGGSGTEDSETHALAVGARGEAYVAATTSSTDLPGTDGAFQPRYGGSGGRGSGKNTNYHGDMFVARLAADGKRLLACTYLGGKHGEGLEGVAVDGAGRVVVSGASYSADFPLAGSPVQSAAKGPADAVLALLSADLRQLVWSTRLGGSDIDLGRAVAVGPGGAVALGGQTRSSDWPVRRAIASRHAGGEGDAAFAVLVPVSD
jgi:O-antigen/teichoic acid export membrane protein